jgi:hypothetical protein
MKKTRQKLINTKAQVVRKTKGAKKKVLCKALSLNPSPTKKIFLIKKEF